MPIVHVPYGTTELSLSLPDQHDITWILPRSVAPAPNPTQVIEQAIANPIGTAHLPSRHSATSVAVAINDKTRPVPHEYLLPPLLQHLEDKGFSPADITLMIATGSHTVMPPDEYPLILPQTILDRYSVICHDARDTDNLAYLGETAHGTPVYINQQYLAADIRIVVGNIEPHQFMGFSGGVKSAAIGLSDWRTINPNHAMMTHDYARMGEYERNPMRQDVEEIGRMIGIDFALNSVFNREKEIVKAFFGQPEAIMHVAIPHVRDTFQIPLNQPLDFLILSPGGYPKDINIYQGQKALGHATPVMRDDSTIIWCAACPDGAGSEAYEAWITREDIQSYEDVITQFKQETFRIGPHKAYQIARDGMRVNIRLKSDMPQDLARSLLIKPIVDLQGTVDACLKQLPADAHIGIMPHGNVTIPYLRHASPTDT